MSTKNEIILRMYDELRISGLTVNPTPGQLADALVSYEAMMAEFFTLWNLDVGYNFETTPSLNSETNVPLFFDNMMVYNLAVRMVPQFNKQVPQVLYNLAGSTFSSAKGYWAAQNIRHVAPSYRMPRGSGNTSGYPYINRFMRPPVLPPVSSSTNVIYEGERMDYFEDFSAWLGSNTISSFTIAVDPRLTVNASANADPRITYTLTASDDDSEGPWQYVLITVTDSASRVEKRLINFEVLAVPEVP